MNTVLDIPLDKVVSDGKWKAPPKLKASIKEMGFLLYPIIVRDLDDGTYKLAAGRRRLACYRALDKEEPNGKWQTIKAMVVDETITDAMIALTENCHSDNPLSDAYAIQQAIAGGIDDSVICAVAGMTATEYAKRKKLSLLAPEFLPMLEGQEISYTAAYRLVRLDHAGQRAAWKIAKGDKTNGKHVSAKLVEIAVAQQIGKSRVPLPTALPAALSGNGNGTHEIDGVMLAQAIREFAERKATGENLLRLIGAAEIMEVLV